MNLSDATPEDVAAAVAADLDYYRVGSIGRVCACCDRPLPQAQWGATPTECEDCKDYDNG